MENGFLDTLYNILKECSTYLYIQVTGIIIYLQSFMIMVMLVLQTVYMRIGVYGGIGNKSLNSIFTVRVNIPIFVYKSFIYTEPTTKGPLYRFTTEH